MPLILNPLTITLLLIALIALLTWAHLRYWDAKLGVPLPYDEEREIATPDGSMFTLRRLAGNGDARPPVLMVHGLGANHRNIDAEPGLSLARYVHAGGRDVWLITLRSGRPKRSGEPAVRFRDMVLFDVPLAVDEIRRRTGHDTIDYLGFSMGGILLYACFARTVAADKIGKVVIIGSPGRVDLSGFPAWRALQLFADVGVPELPSVVTRLVAFAADTVVTPIHNIIYNPANVSKGVAPRALVNVLTETAGTLVQDFLRWGFGHGGAITMDGEEVVTSLREASGPALFFAGTRDNLAPPHTVAAAYDAWGGEKELRVLGREHGQREDYGHGCLAIGRDLPTDVFEPVRAFLG